MKVSKLTLVAAVLALIGATAPSAGATHARPKAATPFLAPLVPAYEPCDTPNRTHAAPLSYDSCNPPVQTSPNLTVGTADANGAPAKSVGSVLYKVIGTQGGVDDLDIQMTTSITDVRCRNGVTPCGGTNAADGPDYTGELETNAAFQITDHNNGGTSGTDPATLLQVDFPYPLTCTATADTTVGADCMVTTTADAQVPGVIPEGKRMLVELDQFTVWDGGPDGTVSTPDNSLFFVQGLFVP